MVCFDNDPELERAALDIWCDHERYTEIDGTLVCDECGATREIDNLAPTRDGWWDAINLCWYCRNPHVGASILCEACQDDDDAIEALAWCGPDLL